MRVGLDLDNTLIDYSQLMNQVAWDEGFLEPPFRPKKKLRHDLCQRYGDQQGELHWQWIQAQMYGPRLSEAKLFPNVFECIQDLAQSGFEFMIISHKTRCSNAHPEIAFWAPMRAFLRDHGFFDCLGFKEKDLYFEETREAKCRRIKALDLDIFVDDLEEVFQHPQFPKEPLKVLFGESPHFMSLTNWTEFPFLCRSVKLLPSQPKGWSRLASGGNHPTFVAHGEQGHYLVKFLYVEQTDPRPRFEAETEFYQLANAKGFPVPKCFAAKKPILVTEFIANRSEVTDLKACQAFLQDLAQVPYGPETTIPIAADARFDSEGFQHALRGRLDKLATTQIPQNFLESIHSHSEKIKVQFGWQVLPESLWFLSPSDFGPHNAMVHKSGKTYFIDFEYAGWDDPAKLMADFFWHVGFSWTKEKRWQLIHGFLERRLDKDNQFAQRLHEVLPWVGLEWICIVLNVYLSPFQERKMRRDPQCDLKHLIEQRMARAETQLVSFDANCKWIQNRVGAFL